MSVEYEVRLSRAEDVAEIFALERRVSGAPHWTPSDYASIPGSEDAEGVRRRMWVAVNDANEVLGFSVGKVIGAGEAGVAELESVVVDEKIRRRGIGRRLCEEVIAWCAEEGITSVELEVRSLNYSAIGVYKRLEFVEEGRRRSYYRDPEDDALLMRLNITGAAS